MTDTDLTIRDIQPGDAGWVVQRHGELYAANDGFDSSFEALVAEIMADFLRHRDPATDRAFILARGGERVGCVFCVKLDAETAKLRLFLLQPELRGQGQGARLLQAFIDHAVDCGFKWVTLWTHESHRAACALYARFGFQMTGARSVTSFGVPLVEQTWAKELTG